jgi:hypothetical protein
MEHGKLTGPDRVVEREIEAKNNRVSGHPAIVCNDRAPNRSLRHREQLPSST